MSNSARAVICVLVVALLVAGSMLDARWTERRAQVADAFVDVDHNSGEWVIGNEHIRYTMTLRGGQMRAATLHVNGNSRPITRPQLTDAIVTVDGHSVALGAPDSGFTVASVTAVPGSHFVTLSVRFRSVELGLAATRHYVVYPRAAAVEMWITFEPLGDTPRTIQNLNAFHQRFVAGDVEWVTGLNAPAEEGGSFTRRRHALASGGSLSLGSPTLSSERALPFFTVAAGDYRVFAGLAWSGAWSATFERDDDELVVSMALPAMSAVARDGQSIEGPHAFIGAAREDTGEDTIAVTEFVRQSRGGRAFPALTTFNSWFVHGVNIDEQRVRHDIDYASSIGVELFQLDAGWYTRERPEHTFDFTSGLGSWEVDRERFPSGLAALGEYARARGMQFGLWVEPERVSLATVGRRGLAEASFLAQQDGAYRPGVANEQATDAQICLAYPPARHWVQSKLFELVDHVRPDNLKWDFNRWVHCTRADHGHPVDGGNYAHTRALYEILAELRARYPNLTVENCAGGGHRIDFGLVRLTDTAWMDDRTAPSMHVRRNMAGLMAAFPPAYLFSYVMPHETEPLRGSRDLPLTVRSRMPGVVGLAALLDQLSEGELNVLHQEFALAQRLRGVQQRAISYVLTPQRQGRGDWEVVQQVIPESGTSYLFVYAERPGGPIRVRPYGIDPNASYELRSADRGVIGRVTGADIVAAGLEISEAPESAAQVLVLEPR